MISLKITKEKINQLIKKYSFIKNKNKNYFYFYKKINNITISIFFTGTISLQGNSNEINNFLIKENLIKENKNNSKEHIGGDESGVGDYFGPIVLTLFKYTKNLKNLNIFNKIKDSKKLDINLIIKIAQELIKLKNNYKTYIISNEELNKNWNNNINSKEILAIHYSKLLKNKIFDLNEIIIDGFTTKPIFNKYCIKNNIKIKKNIKLINKAEDKYLGVAAASIISRFIFLNEIKKIEKKLDIKIKLGANSQVKKQIKNILENKKNKNPKKYIKLFFKI